MRKLLKHYVQSRTILWSVKNLRKASTNLRRIRCQKGLKMKGEEDVYRLILLYGEVNSIRARAKRWPRT